MKNALSSTHPVNRHNQDHCFPAALESRLFKRFQLKLKESQEFLFSLKLKPAFGLASFPGHSYSCIVPDRITLLQRLLERHKWSEDWMLPENDNNLLICFSLFKQKLEGLSLDETTEHSNSNRNFSLFHTSTRTLKVLVSLHVPYYCCYGCCCFYYSSRKGYVIKAEHPNMFLAHFTMKLCRKFDHMVLLLT